MTVRDSLDTVSSGIDGLDDLLRGGFITDRMYLVLGEPGTGKTLLGMTFLMEGLEQGETVLFVHGEESREDILANGAAVGIDLADAEFLDLGPESEFFAEERSYDLVDPREVQPERFIEDIRDAIEEINPSRAFIDPISQLQYVEPTEFQFRKRMISLMRFLKTRGTTVLTTKTPSLEDDDAIESLSDGVIRLERDGDGHRIGVPKHRGVGQMDGTSGMAIRSDGIEVYPALVPERHEREFRAEQMASDIDELDALLGGGLERGTATLISGPSGVGKSTTATQFLRATAERGDRAVAYLFEESIETFTHRSEALGVPVTALQDEGSLDVQAVEPLTLSPEEFALRVREQVEDRDAKLVMIDGVPGYKVAIQGDESMLGRKLHALTRYLKNMDVSFVLLDETSEITGMASPTSANISYIADNIVFLNYIEMDGRLERVAGVLKKRVGDFEHTLRRFAITPDGVEVGERLSGVQGILEGTPEWVRADAEGNTD